MSGQERQPVNSTEWPELVFGLVGAIGVNVEAVARRLGEALGAVGYARHVIRLTDLMKQVAIDGVSIADEGDRLQHYLSRIAYANAVRAKCDNDAALAGLAVARIKSLRADAWAGTEVQEDRERLPRERTAYVLRQLKRREEIDLLRKVYGRKFIQISIHAGEEERRRNLARSFAQSGPHLSQEECEDAAEKLVSTDLNEHTEAHGQRVGEVFHYGDAFIDGRTEKTIGESVERFVSAFFGKNSVSPTRDEYGAYMAASAALRSIDPARQVGAAIFSPRGEVVALGCNEVPKFGGGTYWGEDGDTHRDLDDGIDPNRTEKNRMVFDFLRVLQKAGAMKEGATPRSVFDDPAFRRGLKTALVSDITEFGRMTHAEMTAICDAARLGKETKGATVYVTTFPCHNCAKHIIGAGIERVVFIEPYPKSKALAMHGDSAVLDRRSDRHVVFEHFVGISPRRYRDIFEKGSRRSADGSRMAEWFQDRAAPMVEDKGSAYVWNEDSAILSTLGKVAEEVEEETGEAATERSGATTDAPHPGDTGQAS